MVEYELYHYGVKGMKWGVRKQTKQAKKDAKEFARAKMFYGEGAGNRRKLIKNTVAQRSKDPAYKKAFDEALAKQDMAKHVAKARGERKLRDIPKYVGVGMTVATTAYALARKTGADKVVARYAKKTISNISNSVKQAKGRRAVEQMLRNSEWMRNGG